MSDRRFPERLATALRRARMLAATGGVVVIAGLWLAPDRAWRDLLMGSFAMVCLGLAGLFFIALQYASGAVWSIVLRRVGEAMTAALPAGGAGILFVLLLRPSLYPWYGHMAAATEGWAGFKLAWLSYPFFLARTIVYLSVWLGFSRAIRRNSRQQDQEGGYELSRRNTRLSAAFLVVFGITFWLASTDWVMTFEPNWASTIFGIYNFAGMFVAGLAAVTLLALALRQAGPLRASLREDHLLDLGRLMVAFTTFWGYIWFSQYMLIWYTNLSEETPYMTLRTTPGWGKLFVVNFLLNWTLPFLLLLPRANKKNPRTLAAAAILVLMGRVTDLYLLLIPPISPASPRLAVWDLGMLALVAGGFVLLTLRMFFHAEPVPIGDPLLPESIYGHS